MFTFVYHIQWLVLLLSLLYMIYNGLLFNYHFCILYTMACYIYILRYVAYASYSQVFGIIYILLVIEIVLLTCFSYHLLILILNIANVPFWFWKSLFDQVSLYWLLQDNFLSFWYNIHVCIYIVLMYCIYLFMQIFIKNVLI